LGDVACLAVICHLGWCHLLRKNWKLENGGRRWSLVICHLCWMSSQDMGWLLRRNSCTSIINL